MLCEKIVNIKFSKTMKKSLNKNIRKLFAIILTCGFGWLVSYLVINFLGEYSMGLIIFLPIVMGVLVTVIGGYMNITNKEELRSVTFIAFSIFCLGLFILYFNGFVIYIVAAPFGFYFTWVGHLIGYYQVVKGKTFIYQRYK